MRRLMMAVVVFVTTTGPAAAQERDADAWKTLADFNRIAVGWKSDAAKVAWGKANTAYADANPSFAAVLDEWNKNKKLYEVRMPAGVYGETMGTVLCATLDMADGNAKHASGDAFAASASLALDYGDLAYAMELYETANGYYESAYSMYEFAEASYTEAAAFYLSCLADSIGAATLMAQYP